MSSKRSKNIANEVQKYILKSHLNLDESYKCCIKFTENLRVFDALLELNKLFFRIYT